MYITCRPPQPPPRVKRSSVAAAQPGTQRVAPTPIQRPSAPPPAVPAATLDIGEPTSVTINGVNVTKRNAPENTLQDSHIHENQVEE